MPELTITSKGQVTFKKDLLRHLGVKPGDKVAVDLLPDGNANFRAVPAKKGIESIFGMLYHPDNPKLSIEDIKRITEEAWAGKR